MAAAWNVRRYSLIIGTVVLVVAFARTWNGMVRGWFPSLGIDRAEDVSSEADVEETFRNEAKHVIQQGDLSHLPLPRKDSSSIPAASPSTGTPTKMPSMRPSKSPTTSPKPVVVKLKTDAPTKAQVTKEPTKSKNKPVAPPNNNPTRFPTIAPTVSIEDISDSCMSKTMQSTRTALNWSTCAIPFPDEDHTLHPKVPDEVNLTEITLLGGDNWGQLCNKLGLIAGAIHDKKSRNHVLALTKPYAATAWSFDWTIFSNSSDNGVLMDCIECDKDARVIRCDTLLYKGKLYNIKAMPLPVSEVLYVINLFYKSRPKHLGFMGELVQYIQPRSGLKKVVEHAIERFSKEAREKGCRTTVGIHRRFMDRKCYYWFTKPVQYNCAGRVINMQANALEKLINNKLSEEYRNTSSFNDADESLLAKVEQAAPPVMACNYTLARHQQELLNETWPTLFENPPLAFLIADDGQTPQGRSRLEQSRAVHYWQSLERLEDPECFLNKKNHYMFAEMYAMALTDLHMGLVLSSCDDIVAIWRRALGRSSLSSYPPRCYSGYYTDIREPVGVP